MSALQRVIRFCAVPCLLVPYWAVAQVTLESPRGGWKNSEREGTSFIQEVHYPASRVNDGVMSYSQDGMPSASAIRGRIAKSTKKARLVVNGVPMPLSLEDSRFARPYAFPPGSSSIEIKDKNLNPRRVQFYDANVNRKKIGLRVVLSWDSDHTDIDLHVVSPDGQHVFFANRVAGNGGALDVDVTDGYGPEIYAISSPPPGIWQVYVNYFGMGVMDDYSEGGAEKPLTIVQVAIITKEGTPDEKKEIFQVPLRRAGELSLIKSFVYP